MVTSPDLGSSRAREDDTADIVAVTSLMDHLQERYQPAPTRLTSQLGETIADLALVTDDLADTGVFVADDSSPATEKELLPHGADTGARPSARSKRRPAASESPALTLPLETSPAPSEESPVRSMPPIGGPTLGTAANLHRGWQPSPSRTAPVPPRRVAGPPPPWASRPLPAGFDLDEELAQLDELPPVSQVTPQRNEERAQPLVTPPRTPHTVTEAEAGAEGDAVPAHSPAMDFVAAATTTPARRAVVGATHLPPAVRTSEALFITAPGAVLPGTTRLPVWALTAVLLMVARR